ncbi:MAG: hypothetical protein HYX81_03880 [Chloroflexi bacterium]|nr:hypothetical protein [Chloroflexota bacterium]
MSTGLVVRLVTVALFVLSFLLFNPGANHALAHQASDQSTIPQVCVLIEHLHASDAMVQTNFPDIPASATRCLAPGPTFCATPYNSVYTHYDNGIAAITGEPSLVHPSYSNSVFDASTDDKLLSLPVSPPRKPPRA